VASTLIAAILIALLAVLRGGSLHALAETKLRWLPLLFAGFAIQIGFMILSLDVTDGFELTILLLSNALVVAFVLANRHVAGMLLAGIGLALNVIVISANGAMPVSARAADLAGVNKSLDAGLKHERLTDDTTLAWLGDVLPVPVLAEVLSVGDVVLGLGIVRLVYTRTMSSKQGRHRVSAASG
jgi:hypothetical protein